MAGDPRCDDEDPPPSDERGVEALAASAPAAHVRALARICPLAIIGLTLEGIVTAWNPAAEELFGWSANEVLRQRIPIMPDGAWEDLLGILRRLGASGGFGAHEGRRWRKDGSHVDVQVTTAPIVETGGAIVGMFGIYQNIGARKTREAEQRRELDLLQAIVDGIPAPVFYKDTRGAYLGCNAAFVAYVGEPREAIIGKTVYDKWPKDLADTYDAADRALLASRTAHSYEAVVRYADGSRHDVLFHKGVFFDRDGNVGGQVGTVLDITERKRAETALRESEERLARYAFVDALTQLPNRVRFESLVAEHTRAGDDVRFALLYLDLDGFKRINDTLGHGAGDEVLRTVAARFRACLRDSDTVARHGGDEFLIVLPGVHDLAGINAVASRIIEAIAEPIVLENEPTTVHIGVSIGCAIYPGHGDNLETLRRRADEAMYEAKQTGKNRLCYCRT